MIDALLNHTFETINYVKQSKCLILSQASEFNEISEDLVSEIVRYVQTMDKLFLERRNNTKMAES